MRSEENDSKFIPPIDSTGQEMGLDSVILNHEYETSDFTLLTKSQEMDLLADGVVGSMVNHIGLLEDPDDWKDKTAFLEEDLMVRQVYHNESFNEMQNQLPFPVLPDILSQVNVVPPPVPSLVSNEEYGGPFNFELYITPQTVSKNPWVYSSTLNKLFLAMSTAFPIDFKCDWPSKDLFIRATPVFKLAQHSQDLVSRCLAHLTPEANNKNLPEFLWNHVIRCQNSGAIYQGSVDDNIRLSVVVPLEKPQMGTDCVRVLYMFVCKNSCPSGMNRKPVEVVFTLEDEMGQIFGRHNIEVRVCSCPKRDKEKEEKLYTKENTNVTLPPPGKKKKLMDSKKIPPQGDYPVDTTEYPVSLNICGKQNLDLVLKYCYDLMAGTISQHGPNDNIKKCLDSIDIKRKRLEEAPH